jgi:isocitrate lyase
MPRRLRRRAQRVRAHEGDDRRGRGRRAFRGQLASVKKVRAHGRQGAVPTQEAIRKLIAARLAADVCGVPTVLVARTDADSATLLTSDVDERDRRSCAASARPRASSVKPASTGDRARPRLRALRGPDLVRDRHPGPRRGARVRRGIHAQFPASCWPTTARPPSTGRRSSTTRRSRASSASSARWATSSSS